MATLLELAKIKHHAVRSDGAKFLDGVRDDNLDTSWLTVNSAGRVTLQKGLYDELLVVKGEASDDQIKTRANMGAPTRGIEQYTCTFESRQQYILYLKGGEPE